MAGIRLPIESHVLQAFVSEALKLVAKSGPKMSADDIAILNNYRGKLDNSTRFIPPWVKVAVALALGLGTMVGWKRIVVTVGEKIGKTHMTYAQGASAELVTMATILGADRIGVPVSTTHIPGVGGPSSTSRTAPRS